MRRALYDSNIRGGTKGSGGLACGFINSVVVALLLSQTGCAAVLYSRSKGVAADETMMRGDGATVTVRMSQLDLSVGAENFVARWLILMILPIPLAGLHPTPKRAPIWVEITPHDGPVQFDPAGSVIVDAKGDTLHPIACWGPGAARLDRSRGECECGVPKWDADTDLDKRFTKRDFPYDTCFNLLAARSSLLDHTVRPVLFSRPTCFMLVFDGHRTGFAFTFIPGGIEAHEQRVDVPVLRFKRGLSGEYQGGGWVWI